MATELEILTRRVERIERLLEKVLPTIPLGMSSGEQTEKFINDADTDRKERPTPTRSTA